MRRCANAAMKALLSASLVSALVAGHAGSALGCTGIRLIAEDGSTVYGRTMEWGAFDLNSRVAIIPRGHVFTGLTPEGAKGRTWTAKYGMAGLDILENDWFADGMNEAGLAAGLFYHPGFAEYPDYDPAEAGNTISPVDVVAYILTQFATIDEVKAGMSELRVVGVLEKMVGLPDPGHWMVTAPSGRSIVIEYAEGEVRFFENRLGVITNSPTYDWHMTNLRNYINLSAVSLPTLTLEEMDFGPLGAGSGMIGLPGDNTPPSRLVRAVAWTQTARPTPDSSETVYEILRILDNFNLPLGGAEGADIEGRNEGMRSSTIWTTAWDLENRVLYFHTQHNRRLRKVGLEGLDFSGEGTRHIALDRQKAQDILDLTPGR
ncbi:MAG: choloylglycine hydrolase family protein [Rhodospirillales bacterium]|nr:MAG: choloylglycine hydrolase family protein [Rhodospirillales bacterium]